ncbi:MAG: ParA family protein [Candidatus Aquirickettsiella sp.]
MGKIIAIVNQKGGVGKTTTCINLAASMALLEQKTLLIDLDPQANATTGSLLQKNLSPHIAQVLLDEVPIEQSLIVTPANYTLIPGSGNLTQTEIQLLKIEQREYTLKKKLSLLADTYDYILLDCPPSLNILTVNALVAAHFVIIPVQCEYFALEGLSNLMNTLQSLRASVNPHLQIHGILRTLFDGRNSLAKQISEELFIHFKDKMYNTLIPRNIRLAEAPSHGQPALLYDPQSNGSQAYFSLAKEVLTRDGCAIPSIESPTDIPSNVFLKKRSNPEKSPCVEQVL